MDVSTEYYQRWLKVRRRTTILFTLESLLIGMDYSLTFLTLWLYINTLVKPKNPNVYYSIISAAFLTGRLFYTFFLVVLKVTTRIFLPGGVQGRRNGAGGTAPTLILFQVMYFWGGWVQGLLYVKIVPSHFEKRFDAPGGGGGLEYGS